MKKSGILISILIVIGVVIFQHRTTPNVPFPTTYQKVGDTVRVPVTMKLHQSADEYWTLSRTSDSSRYFVSVYNKYKLVRQFSTKDVSSSDSTGKNYTSSGQIKFDLVPYQVASIHVNRDQKTGFIVFQPVNQTANGGQQNTAG